MTVQPITELARQINSDSWTPIDLTTLADKPPVQPTLGHTSLVYPGKRHVFSGPPESAKTLAAYCILIQVARHGGRAILIDFEMGAYDARQRLIELAATTDEISRILYLEPDERATVERITKLIDRQPQLVVVDAAAGAYQLEGLDDNKRADVEHLARLYVTAFWRAGIATIHIDHVVKNTETRGRFVIGSERKLGAADVHLGFETIKAISRGNNGRYKIITHKDRGGYLRRGHLADFHVESDPDTHLMAWRFTEPENETTETGSFRPTGLMEKVSTHLSLQSQPLKRNDICDAIGGRKKYVLDAIAALVAERFAAEETGPNNSRLVRHVSHFRESADTANGSTMRAEPREPYTTQATLFESAKTAYPSGSSRFPSGSRVVPGTESGGGSPVPPYVVGEPEGTADTDHPEPEAGSHDDLEFGWFDADGHLYQPDIPAAAPDDIDWNTP